VTGRRMAPLNPRKTSPRCYAEQRPFSIVSNMRYSVTLSPAFGADKCPQDIASDDGLSELSFKKGEVLDIIDNSGKWWYARKADGVYGSESCPTNTHGMRMAHIASPNPSDRCSFKFHGGHLILSRLYRFKSNSSFLCRYSDI